jgi:NADPH-dependent glutamate synthase beta subunit-like oxidoreductase/Pyruvate/2-oxoacid:ferredoxin oxidoreductase delta subunit
MVKLDPESLADLPPTSYSDLSTSALQTGTWKYLRPEYRDGMPPCTERCPAGNDVSGLLALLAAGRVDEAARRIREGNPLPATLGRVCPHPCQDLCNRSTLGGAIEVRALERLLGDYALAQLAPPEPVAHASGRRVAVIGAGPAGIATAYVLAHHGHAVEVLDDKPAPGGYLRTGIPEYRLPKRVLDAELARVEAAGVRFRSGVRVGRDIPFEALRRTHDAVVIATGMHASRGLGVPGSDRPRVRNGVSLLEELVAGGDGGIEGPVLVVGGGNTAMDVARSVLRLGHRAVVVYRRDRTSMPAIAEEVDEAAREGVQFHFLAAPVRVLDDGDRLELECTRMRLGEPDASGRRAPVEIPGTGFRLEAGCIVSATGETADLGFLPEVLRGHGRIGADERGACVAEGVFACGDAASGEGTVAAAVGNGRRVGAMVHEWLVSALPAAAPRPRDLPDRAFDRDRRIGPDQLNPAYFALAPAPAIPALHPDARRTGFDEVLHGLTLGEAVSEARRCLLCGTCNECRNCLEYCPDAAIHALPGGGFEIDDGHCKGCGICAAECPRGALLMVEVGR